MSNRSLYLLTPDMLLRAYAAGIFPMAESAEAADLRWFDPPMRALIPLEPKGADGGGFHVGESLRRAIRKRPFTIMLNAAFGEVIKGCAAPRPGRESTWINREIVSLYTTLHWRGQAHSIEAWQNGKLMGGLYGVALGSAFFGESMFSRATDASKIVLVYTAALLRHSGFTLFDTQFQTEHLARFGTFEVTRGIYHHLLEAAIKKPAELRLPKGTDWDHLAAGFTSGASLQPVSQIS